MLLGVLVIDYFLLFPFKGSDEFVRFHVFRHVGRLLVFYRSCQHRLGSFPIIFILIFVGIFQEKNV